MAVVEWITGLILTLAFLMFGIMKLRRHPMTVDVAEKLGYQKLQMLIGTAEVLGAVGVFIGVVTDDFEWVGVLAAIGLVALMIGALSYHVRGGDKPKDMMPPVVMAVLAVVYIIALAGN